jgi:glycosyltransferase involved in cell wall biosynthesis
MLQPYRMPVFNALARRSDLDFRVLLLSVKEANRQWEVDFDRVDFQYEVLPSTDFYFRALDYGLHLNRGVIPALKRHDPEVVVGTGYTSPTYWKAQRFIHRRGGGYALWSGSTLLSSRVQTGPVRWAKRRFVRGCDAYLAYGSAAREYLENLGADPARIIQGTNTVDVDLFANLAERARRDSGYAQWRAGYPPHLVLFVGQMIDRKGVPELIAAFSRAGRADLGLVIVGDGPMLPAYRDRYSRIPRLFWEGYRQTREMGPYLAAADALAMPSAIEVWGLVVNEALAAGVPVIATDCSGATRDLIVDSVNGYSYRSGDVDRLADLLATIPREPDRWRKMGEEGARRMKQLGPDHYADCFAQAVHRACRENREGSS